MQTVPTFKVQNYSSANAHRFVKLVADHTVALCGSGERPIGVQEAQYANDSVAYVVPVGSGAVEPLRAGGAFSPNTPLKSDGSGNAVQANGGETFYAVAVGTAVNVGDLVDAVLTSGVA